MGNQIGYAESAVKSPVVSELRSRGATILAEAFDAVMAYHGCRPRDIRSYEEKGILPSNLYEQEKIARDHFKGFEGIEGAIKQVLNPDYRDQNHGKVWLYFSGVYTRRERVHIQGGEFLRSGASRLGPRG